MAGSHLIFCISFSKFPPLLRSLLAGGMAGSHLIASNEPLLGAATVTGMYQVRREYGTDVPLWIPS